MLSLSDSDTKSAMTRKYQQYFYCEACNLPLMTVAAFKAQYFVSDSQVRRLLRDKVLFGKFFKSRMNVAINPSITRIEDFI